MTFRPQSNDMDPPPSSSTSPPTTKSDSGAFSTSLSTPEPKRRSSFRHFLSPSFPRTPENGSIVERLVAEIFFTFRFLVLCLSLLLYIVFALLVLNPTLLRVACERALPHASPTATVTRTATIANAPTSTVTGAMAETPFEMTLDSGKQTETSPTSLASTPTTSTTSTARLPSTSKSCTTTVTSTYTPKTFPSPSSPSTSHSCFTTRRTTCRTLTEPIESSPSSRKCSLPCTTTIPFTTTRTFVWTSTIKSGTTTITSTKLYTRVKTLTTRV